MAQAVAAEGGEVKLEHYGAPDGWRSGWRLSLGPVAIETSDWSLSRRVGPTEWVGLFALRCDACGRFGGCDDHWFCGMCSPCLKRHDLAREDE